MFTRGSHIEIVYFSRSPKRFGQSFQGIWVSQRPPTYSWSWSCYSFDSKKCSSKHQALQISICPKEWELIQKLQKILVQTILWELDKEGKIILEPEVVIEPRNWQLQNRSISEYLIKWKNLPTEDSTWEDKNFIQKHPELLKHWGQHSLKERGMLGP